jgi:uncharacterized protein YfaS (alpha-2-macroglobulin family)
MLMRKPLPVFAGVIFPLLTSVIIVGLSCGHDPERDSVAGKLPAAAGAPPAATPAARAPSPLPARKSMPRSTRWSEVDKLAADQKFEEARRVVAEIQKAAQKSDNAGDLTEALIRDVQLQIGLSGYETAVRSLRAQPWPADLLSQASLQLYYAHALTTYRNAYSWEIGKREKVESKDAVDLKAWTSEQIYAEVLKAFAQVWVRREELGQQPLAELKPFLDPGTYPDAVRGTLRDAVSYLLVEELANTATWRPEQSDEVSHLDFAALLRGQPVTTAPVKVDDPALHPVVKLNAVLVDLEAFHTRRGAREAALEAHLQRLQRLHAAFSQERERAAVRAALVEVLDSHRSLPWWAVGQAQLARFFISDEGDLPHAYKLAMEGWRAYPDTVGGKLCLSIYKGLAAPEFTLTAMGLDAPKQRSVLVTHKNLPVLYFRAYAWNLLQHLEGSREYQLLWGDQQVREVLRSGKPVAEWKVELPATPDLRTHQTYVTPPLGATGAYVILASSQADFGESNNRVLGVNLILSDLVLVSRERSGERAVTVVSGRTGQPVAGVQVSLYQFDYGRPHARKETQTTSAGGEVKFKGNSTGSLFLVAQKGGDISLDPQFFTLYRYGEASETRASLVFTDRSIYRPQQKLFWKVIAYRGRADQGSYKTASGTRLTVNLRDPNNQEVAKLEVTTNDFGTASGEFLIPSGRLLGRWSVNCMQHNGSAQVRVEEYKRPTFEVSLKDPPQALRLNRPASLTGEARYYFGLPVTAGSVSWRVSRLVVFPWWWGLWGRATDNTGGQIVAAGKAPLQADGTFSLQFTPAADERQDKSVTYTYAVSADLTDEGGETRSASRNFQLGFVAVQASVELDAGFITAAAPGALVTVRRTSLDGVARPGSGTYRLLALEQPKTTVPPAELPLREPPLPPSTKAPPYKTPGDRLRSRWAPDYRLDSLLASWPDGKELASGQLSHDEKGEAVVTLPALAAGPYRLRYQTTDEFGEKAEAWREFIVAGPKTPVAAPLVVQLERSSVRVGETARLLIASGLPEQPLLLDLFRDGVLRERRALNASSAAVVELPVSEAERGGLGIVVWMVRDHQYLSEHLSLSVPWDNKELHLSFSTFRDKLRPGTRETFRILVKNPEGQPLGPGLVELLAYMYDKSLDLFGPHYAPTVASLYPARGGVTWARTNLAQTYPLWIYNQLPPLPQDPALQPTTLVFFDQYGIGGPGVASRSIRYFSQPMLARAAVGGVAPPPPPPPPGAPPPAQAPAPAGGEPLGNTRAEKGPAATTPPADSRGPATEAAGPQLRSNFAETAFFYPRLLTEKDGTAAIEFAVPDSVTAWSVWVHAVTQDLAGGRENKVTRTVKELLVRPYLPRFFREGDRADLKVVINNAGDKPLAGTLRLEITEPDATQSLLALFGVTTAQQPFRVEPGKSTALTFPVTAPRKVGSYAFKVSATAGDLGDGELRPLPVLPSRLHLSQSRFVTLKDKDSRTLTFADLAKNDDPSRVSEQLVVTLDAQLFYAVLKALPYLIEYPYECTEQTLNRFLSTGIAASLFDQYPAIAKMAKEFAQRKTALDPFDHSDPNRKLTLEESPWLQTARGGQTPDRPLINVLDPNVARMQRDTALSKLGKSQLPNGAFPWFPGGPPSPFMTLYLMHGFAKAAEFKVEVPKDVVQKGWRYLGETFRSDFAARLIKDDTSWEFLTLLNYVASAYPDPSWVSDALSATERQQILAFSFKHWRQHSPYLKGLLALTLKRMGRRPDAELVWASVMDSAKTAPDQGTFWAAEDRSWLWYNDTIESHAFALRTMLELTPQDSRRDGLVLWLLLNKKLNQWKSTRATAEVIYSLVHYLKLTGGLGVREEATVAVGSRSEHFVFEPDKYVGKTQLVIPGPQVDPRTSSTITVQKPSKGVMFASATWHFATDRLPTEDRGDFFQVSRTYFRRQNNGREFVLTPLAEGTTLAPGDEVEVQLSLRSKAEAEYVHLRDPRAAGLEPENAVSRYKWDLGIGFYEEVRDSGSNFFFEHLPAGQYTFKYRLRANLGGTFRVGPAVVQSMYAPEFTAYSAGHQLTIGAGK